MTSATIGKTTNESFRIKDCAWNQDFYWLARLSAAFKQITEFENGKGKQKGCEATNVNHVYVLLAFV
jgi:hypothetical protein